MKKYAGLIKNDFAGAPGVQLTFFTQGCPFHCKNCHNPETWNFNGGIEFTDSTLKEIIKSLTANGISRVLGLQGGEPLCPENLELVDGLIQAVKIAYPNIKVYIWTGYLYEELKESKDEHLQNVLQLADFLIDGPYIEAERDITLHMRGSKNQRIWDLKTKKRCKELEG